MSITKKLENVKEIVGRLVGEAEVTVVDGNVRSIKFITIEERPDGGPGPEHAYTIEMGPAYSSTMHILTDKQPPKRTRYGVRYTSDGAECVFKAWEESEVLRHLRAVGVSDPAMIRRYKEDVIVDDKDEDKVVGEDIPF